MQPQSTELNALSQEQHNRIKRLEAQLEFNNRTIWPSALIEAKEAMNEGLRMRIYHIEMGWI